MNQLEALRSRFGAASGALSFSWRSLWRDGVESLDLQIDTVVDCKVHPLCARPGVRLIEQIANHCGQE